MKIPKNSTFFIEENKSFEQWSAHVSLLSHHISNNDAQRWLLFELQPYQFSLYFFALLMANKQIVIPQNGQDQQLRHCMTQADIYIGSQSLEGCCTFNLDLSNEMTCLDIPEVSKAIVLNESTSILFFTSGSTGAPKAINKTFGQLVKEIVQLEHRFGHKLGTGCVMSTVSHQHIYGLLFKLLWPIWSGRDVFLKPFEYPEHLAHEVTKNSHRQVCLIGSPAYFHRLVKDNVLIDCKHNFEVIFSSGGPLDFNSSLALQRDLDCGVIEVFGSTETGGIAWRQRQSIDNELWNLFDDIAIQVNVITQQLSLKSPYISGDSWFETDDRVGLRDNNKFQLLGRVDRVIKLEEKRCSLDDIESTLARHEFINEVSIILLIHKQSTQRDCLGAIIALSPEGEKVLLQQSKLGVNRLLKQYLKSFFETLVIPRKFRYVAQLPYNAQGKLDKKQLEQFFD